MKKFILYSAIFISIQLLPILSGLLIPDDLIYFRNWELQSAKTSSLFIGPFYPNRHNTMDEYGDLTQKGPNSVLKQNVEWQIDKLGYRNREFLKKADIVVLGSSNMTGSASSQDQIISEQLSRYTKKSTYNISPAGFNHFINLVENEIIDKPEYFIYGLAERLIPDLGEIKDEINKDPFIGLKLNSTVSSATSTIDRIMKLSHIRKLYSLIFRKHSIIQSPIDSKMVFHQGQASKLDHSDDEIREHARIISSYAKYCEKIRVKFIFFPVPNKETIYYEKVPFQIQPNYLTRLDSFLKEFGVLSMNTLELYNANKASELLYHYDDSHWNAPGIELSAKELAKLINTN